MEYYLSDENLKFDKFFHDKISAEKEGWLEMELILSCNKMKTMRATKAFILIAHLRKMQEDVVAALKESKIEVKEAWCLPRSDGRSEAPG